MHAQKKRVAGPAYSMPSMQANATGGVEETIALLRRRLDGFAAAAGGEVDLGSWLHFFAFDVVGEVAFGKRWGFLDEGRDVEGCIRAIDESQRYNGLVGQLPALDGWLRGSGAWRAWQRVWPGAVPLVTRIALEEIGRRRRGEGEGKGKGRDLLAQLLRANEASPERFGEGDVFAVTHGAM